MSEIRTDLMSRRAFFKRGGAIVVGFSMLPAVMAQSQPAPLPGSLQNNRMLDGWLRINADGTVTVFTGKVELGQGIVTALAQIAADELDVNFERIEMISADTSRSPNEGMTAGSQSVEQSGTALHYAAAEAREILLQLAAARLGVGADKLTVSDGTVSAGGAKTTYWELAQSANFKREATARAKPKAAARRNVIGKSVPRRDIPKKVRGEPAYVQDMRLPSMVFGRVVRPPSRRAQLESLDEATVRGDARRRRGCSRRQFSGGGGRARGAGDQGGGGVAGQCEMARNGGTAAARHGALRVPAEAAIEGFGDQRQGRRRRRRPSHQH